MKRGATRIVFFLGAYAIKLPALYSWRGFLIGLLANMTEREFSAAFDAPLCPVLFSLPGGFANVMPKAQPLSSEEFKSLDLDAFLERGDWVVPAERKQCSFGWLNGRIVVVDYA